MTLKNDKKIDQSDRNARRSYYNVRKQIQNTERKQITNTERKKAKKQER